MLLCKFRTLKLLPMVLVTTGVAWGQTTGGAVQLPTGDLLGDVPGTPQRVNSLPMALAVSPDGRYVVSVNAGYGTVESGLDQSLAVFDRRSGNVQDFPDARTAFGSHETLFSGLAFSADGQHLYASLASMTDPKGAVRKDGGSQEAGSGIAVYGFSDGRITQERVIAIAPQPLPLGRKTKLHAGGPDGRMGVPFPAAIAVATRDGERLLVADNLSDQVLLITPQNGTIQYRFDLSESDAVPGTYPIAVAISKDGTRGFVALWNASEVVELDLVRGTVGRKIALFRPTDPVQPGSHPCALVLSPDGRTLYVALANRDAVAAIDVTSGKAAAAGAARFRLKGYFDTRLPGQSYFGAEPDAVAVSLDGRHVYAADMNSDAIAVIAAQKLTPAAAKKGMVEPDGFIPTEWMPISLTVAGPVASQPESLMIATAKGRGTGPNVELAGQTGGTRSTPGSPRPFTYIAKLLYGSLATVNVASIDLKAATSEVLQANRMHAAQEHIPWSPGVLSVSGPAGPIHHVIYLIRENRTYDQILGDLQQNGHSIGNGDPTLTMYGADITPNAHRLALQFGVMDNFFAPAEVSGGGHIWSNAAIGSDYLEKTWQQSYRNSERAYDYEGVVAQGYPLEQKIADVAEPATGYMWGNAERHGRTHYNFGEYISSAFCDAKASTNPQQGPVLAGGSCASAAIAPGGAIPAEWGGGVNRWPWPIPLLKSNVPTKPELVGHFAEEAPDFNLRVPDQIRAEIFLRHFGQWVTGRAAGHDTMPNYITIRLGNDHTAGTVPGGPSPRSSVADNDLALGRIVDAVSHSAYWDDTAIVTVEDDAQNGADHVDAHRTVALVISKYAPHPKSGGAFVDSRFYNTVSLIRTMESLLGLPPMNNNDALAPLIGSLFTGPGDQASFAADYRNRDNGLIYAANTPNAPGAKESTKLDFRHEDRADPRVLNAILWRDAKGDVPVPEQVTRKVKEKTKDDDD